MIYEPFQAADTGWLDFQPSVSAGRQLSLLWKITISAYTQALDLLVAVASIAL